MTQFAKYDKTGRVLFLGDVPEEMLALQGDRVFVGPIDPETQYIVGGQARARPANPAARQGQNLYNLPAPCQITINGKVYDCPDTTAALDFTYPGTYHVRVSAFPFLDAEFELTI